MHESLSINYLIFIYNVVCITETRLNSSIFDLEILSTNYFIYCKDRCTHRGGVLVALEESIPSSNFPLPRHLEVMSVVIELNVSISVCTVCIPPNPSDLYLLSYVADVISSSEFVIIVGDFNLPDINWSALTGTPSLSSPFCDSLFDYNPVQFVGSPDTLRKLL